MSELEQLLKAEPVLVREVPQFGPTLSRWAAKGKVTAILPGVYVPAECAHDVGWRAAAVCRWDPAAVVVGAAAARLGFWRELPVDVVSVAVPGARRPQAGFSFQRRQVPAEQIVRRHGIAITSPALTAVDLAVSDNGCAIDELLRRRLVTIGMLERALTQTSGRRGHATRRRVVALSRTMPWSQAELLLHELLTRARIRGWRANVEIRFGEDRYYLDVAFPARRIAIEVDGLAFHHAGTADHDLKRQNQLVLAGWTVLRFTWRMLCDDPEGVLASIRAAIG